MKLAKISSMAGLRFKKTVNLSYKSDSESEDGSETISKCSDDVDYKGQTSDEDFSPSKVSKRLRTISPKNRENQEIKMQRRPTRVPNPKVTNRNAIMARENRKRKREVMENMQVELQNLLEENKKLKKSLSKSNSVCFNLERERDYLKSVLANQNGITTILNALKNKVPVQAAKPVQLKARTTSYTSSSSAFSSLHDDGSVSPLSDDPLLSDSMIVDSFFTDPVDWKNPLLEDSYYFDAGITDIPAPPNDISSTIDMNSTSDAGVCLHLNNGHISLEFCADCHFNAKMSFEDENQPH